MFINSQQKIKEALTTTATLEDVKGLMEAADIYSNSLDKQLEETDFRSILYITPADQKQLAFDMIESMTLYLIRETRINGVTNQRVVVLCPEDRNQYWRDKFNEFPEVLQIFNSFNLLSMSLLNYASDHYQYSVIIDQDVSDLVCFEGINAFQAFLSLPFVSDCKYGLLSWCSDTNIAILASMFWDMFTCKLAFKDSFQVPLIQDLFGNDSSALSDISDFKMASGNDISDCGLQRPLTEMFLFSMKDRNKPLGG